MTRAVILSLQCLSIALGLNPQWELLANAPWQARGHFGAVVSSNGTMLISGGMHTANNTHLNDVWSSKDGRTWELMTTSAPWPQRHRHGMAFLKGCAYIFGGTTVKNTTNGTVQFNYNDVWKSCDLGRSWECVTKNAQWTPREGFAFTVAGDRMLIIGGTVHDVGGAVNEVWSSPDGKDWELLSSNETIPANAWAPRYALTAVTMPQGEVMIAGGFGANAMRGFADVWTSRDGGKTWEQRSTDADFGHRCYVGLGVVGNSTYLIGGQAGALQLFRSFGDVWNTLDGSEWHKVDQMPSDMAPRGGLGVLNTGDAMVMIAGSSEIFPHQDFNDVWRLKPKVATIVV